MCKGLSAACQRAGKGLFSCVDPCVSCQVASLGKNASAALDRADKGLFSCVDPCVCLQVAALGKGASTVLMVADKGFFSRVAAYMAAQTRQGTIDTAAAVKRATVEFFAGVTAAGPGSGIGKLRARDRGGQGRIRGQHGQCRSGKSAADRTGAQGPAVCALMGAVRIVHSRTGAVADTLVRGSGTRVWSLAFSAFSQVFHLYRGRHPCGR